MSIFDKLSRPFDASQVSWRAQTMKADGTAAMALCYIDARDVMRRLDEVCGPAGWSDSYTETAKGRLICTITIKCGDEWISKSDGAGDTDVEGEKGAISDAFKRAAVKWGVGRYLYDLDAVWAECESYEKNSKKMWRRWTPKGAAQLAAAAKNAVAPVLPRDVAPAADVLVSEEELHRLQDAAGDVGADLQAFCKFMGVTSLKTIPQSRFDEAMNALSKKKKAA